MTAPLGFARLRLAARSASVFAALVVCSGAGAGRAAAHPGLDLNRATAEELEALPGFGPAKARAWIAWRATYGPCRTLDDVANAPGFGLASVRGLGAVGATCGPAVAPAPAPIGAGVPWLRPRAVDPNTASVEELLTLPGVDAELAAAIVEERIEGGAFSSCHDLARVPAIGEATLAMVAHRCATAARPGAGGARNEPQASEVK